jgi:alpha-ketoglutarate-dependent taurine dioxygenase
VNWRARDFKNREDFSADFRSDAYEEVRSGRGFALLRGLPVHGASLEEFTAEVAALGARFGRALSQNAQGELIGHVVDAAGAESTPRLFRTNLELRPHTDNAPIVLLACWNAAQAGGETMLTSALTVHEQMRASRPDLLALLYQGFHCHRRGEQAPHEEPITPYRVPVFCSQAGVVSCRYQRALIAAGQRELARPLSKSDIEALDLFDETATSPENCVKFALERGDVLVLNNYTVLHARTRFVEYPEPGRRRHLIRIWLDAEGFRAVPIDFRLFPSAEGVPPQPGVHCSYDFEKLYREDPAASGSLPRRTPANRR